MPTSFLPCHVQPTCLAGLPTAAACVRACARGVVWLQVWGSVWTRGSWSGWPACWRSRATCPRRCCASCCPPGAVPTGPWTRTQPPASGRSCSPAATPCRWGGALLQTYLGQGPYAGGGGRVQAGRRTGRLVGEGANPHNVPNQTHLTSLALLKSMLYIWEFGGHHRARSCSCLLLRQLPDVHTSYVPRPT